MTQKPIENSYWVIPGRFLAGEYPRNFEENSSKEKIKALVEGGVTAFIDLTEVDEGLLPYTHLLEGYESKGVSHQRFSIGDYSIPGSKAFTRAILDTIDCNLAEGEIVYLHCMGGVGRTGTVVGCWLARHGHHGQSALNKLQELWRQNPKSADRKSPETAEQEAYIVNWDKS
jgi:hypothetical protein